MCDKSCQKFGKCEKCRNSKKRGKELYCHGGDRRGPHSRCFRCKDSDRCKKARGAG